MRVLFFLSSYRLGITRLLVDQCIALSRVVPVHGIAGHTEQEHGLFHELDEAQVPYTIIEGLEYHSEYFRMKAEVQKALRCSAAELVHVQTNWQLALARNASGHSQRHIPIVYTVHGYRHNSPIKSIIARHVIGCALRLWVNLVVFPTRTLMKHFPFVGSKAVVLPLGVSDTFFEVSSARVGDENRKEIIFAGQFRHGKRQAWIIEAIHRFMAASRDCTVHVWLPGDGPLRSQCQALTESLKISHVVTFPGNLQRAELMNLYRRCSFAIIPSNNETFGHCIAEPLVLGKTVITRPVGIACDFVNHGVNGWVFNTADDLTEALHVLLPDSNLSRQLGDCAHRVRDYFRWSRISEQYATIVSGLFSNGPYRPV